MDNYPANFEGYTHSVSNLRAYLVGTWTLTRNVEDGLTGDCGRFIGKATFEPVGLDLIGREEGMLSFRLYCDVVTRCYYYSFPTRKVSYVHFDHGGFFHCLDLSVGHCAAEHFCGADRYHGNFWAQGADLWTVVWRVRGPDKDHGIVSYFEREEKHRGR